MDNPLSEIPLLEEVASILLMCWMDFRQVDHLLHQLSLRETLVNDQVILLMHGSMATLTGSLEHVESSSKRGRVVGLEAGLRWPVVVTVVHTN